MWPELQDDHLENSREYIFIQFLAIFLTKFFWFLGKVPLDRHDIIIDKVAASHDNNFVVAVTSNNMVCIWKRVEDSS